MLKKFYLVAAFALAIGGFAPLSKADESTGGNAEAAILAQLQALPGVEAMEKTTDDDRSEGMRRFELKIDQPVDHFDPNSPTFKQKLVLFHRDYAEPMVLQTSGYLIFSERLSRIARVFATNQIQVEHRYFAGSSPQPKDWTKLNVRQSAEDFHRIVTTLKTLYKGRWVNTGASKGGMTSVFHRRFYPGDLDGTVADVAPFSFALRDERYVDFVKQAGGPAYAECRQSLEDFQLDLLRRRAEYMATLTGTFDAFGGKEKAFEEIAVSLPFTFWQYGDPTDPQYGCVAVPKVGAPMGDIVKFVEKANNPDDYTDATSLQFQPYYYQVANELGGPADRLEHVQALLQHPYLSFERYLPAGENPAYNPQTILDVRDWVAQSATQIIFVYGEFDPWTTGMLAEINAAPNSDNHLFMVAGGNHGANFQALAPAEKADATATIARWLNKSPAPLKFTPSSFEESLEEVEARMIRGARR